MATAHSRVRRTLRAQVRDARVLLTESRGPLLLFAAILILSSLALQVFYVNPETGARPDPGEALFAALGLVFFQTTFPFPDQWGLRLLYFIIPIVGLVAAGDAGAGRVRLVGCHHSASATPARRLTTRVSTKSKSDRRFM
jgi:hypothetical protein